MEVSIIIPFRSSDYRRQQSFNWVFQRWQHWYPEAEIIVSNPETESFSRSEARNKGVRLAKNDLIIMADADTYCSKQEPLDLLLELVQGREVPWGLPYEIYFNASDECSQYLLKQNPETFEPIETEIGYDHRLTDSISGVYVTRKQDWEECGGLDERFLGWGYEDRAIQLSLDTLIGPHFRMKDSFVIHLWHPAPEENCFGQPYIEQNRALYNRYLWAGGSRSKMEALVSEHASIV